MILPKASTRGTQRGHHDQNNGVEIVASIVFPTSEERIQNLAERNGANPTAEKLYTLEMLAC